MDNKETKKYGGCLSILLPLWVIGQIFSLIRTFIIVGFDVYSPIAIVLMFAIPIITLIGITLLLNFKKTGFYVLISASLLASIVAIIFPDDIDSATVVRTFLWLGLFLVLMGVKNKETNLNGYQVLGLIKKKSNSEKSDTGDNSDKDSQTIVEDIEHVRTQDYVPLTEQPEVSQRHISKKTTYITLVVFASVALLSLLFLFIMNRKTDEEIYNEAENLITAEKYEEAIAKLESIENDYVPAKTLLGDLYCNNKSVGIDKEKGERLLWEAFELNDTTAGKKLNSIYSEEEDWDKIYEVSNKLINLGCLSGYRSLAWIYFTDEMAGAKNYHKNYSKTKFYAEKIADNDAIACLYLGNIYRYGDSSLKKDYIEAFYWCEKGAKLGSSRCYNNLGFLYLNYCCPLKFLNRYAIE